MARKDRKDREDKPQPAADASGEDYAFALPDFDERAFMTREIQGARVTFVAAGVGLVAGLLARLTYVGTEAANLPWQVALLPVFASIYAVPHVARRFGADVDPKDWKQILGNGFLVFFTALVVWILLLNEPFA